MPISALTQHRKAQNKSKRQLSQDAGILVKVLEQLEEGLLTPSLSQRRRLARALGVLAEELFPRAKVQED